MEKQKNTQMFVIVVLSVVLLTMSVGFAAFSQTLNINGNVTVKSASWNVAFDTDSYHESTGSVNVGTSDRSISATSMSYNVTLNKPGDFYEFTITVKNTGTFDADLKKITLSAVPTANQNYLTYKLYYNSTEYTATTDNLSISLAKTSGTATVKVRVDYVQPENSADLPSTEQNITLTASLDYAQKAA